jgi:hypothetical protein
MSSITSQINHGMRAHAAWKSRLFNAVQSGHCTSDPAIVATDNNCDFGKWLYEEIDPALKKDRHYQEIIKLHAEFHKSAAEIVKMVKSGRLDEAMAQLDPKSDFIKLANKMTMLLSSWRNSLAA